MDANAIAGELANTNAVLVGRYRVRLADPNANPAEVADLARQLGRGPDDVRHDLELATAIEAAQAGVLRDVEGRLADHAKIVADEAAAQARWKAEREALTARHEGERVRIDAARRNSASAIETHERAAREVARLMAAFERLDPAPARPAPALVGPPKSPERIAAEAEFERQQATLPAATPRPAPPRTESGKARTLPARTAAGWAAP